MKTGFIEGFARIWAASKHEIFLVEGTHCNDYGVNTGRPSFCKTTMQNSKLRIRDLAFSVIESKECTGGFVASSLYLRCELHLSAEL